MTTCQSSANGEPTCLRATVVASLPNEMFRLRLPDDRQVLAHVAMDLRKVFTRLLAGDLVEVEVSPFDPNKARIMRHIARTQ